jgi:hypothetical protein
VDGGGRNDFHNDRATIVNAPAQIGLNSAASANALPDLEPRADDSPRWALCFRTVAAFGGAGHEVSPGSADVLMAVF